MSDKEETRPESPKFDFSAFPADTLFYDRRSGLERRDRPVPVVIAPPVEETPKAPPERRARKERRRRIDPTTFEKQYTEAEIEFMTAMQQFKTRTGRPFPSHRDVIAIAASLGYRKAVPVDEDELDGDESSSREIEPALPV